MTTKSNTLFSPCQIASNYYTRIVTKTIITEFIYYLVVKQIIKSL